MRNGEFRDGDLRTVAIMAAILQVGRTLGRLVRRPVPLVTTEPEPPVAEVALEIFEEVQVEVKEHEAERCPVLGGSLVRSRSVVSEEVPHA